jgi:DNA-directed RNA polymerase specialized sigma24 family protein
MTISSVQPPELRQFNTEIYDLLRTQNPRARSLLSFIRRTLREFHIDSLHTEFEVFNEAYMRGVTFVLKGNTIRSPKAWMRTTTFNVIRELSREQRRYQPTDCENIENLLVTEDVIELDIRSVAIALQSLELSDRRIIELKTMQNLSWKEVGQRLVELGEKHQNEAALRKRGQRAMQRLRQLYHESRPAESLVI